MSRFRPSSIIHHRPPEPVSASPATPAVWSSNPSFPGETTAPPPAAPAPPKKSVFNLARREAIATPPQQVGFWLLSLFLFHSSSRILDQYLMGWHLPLVLSICCLICLFMSGRLFTGISSKIGVALTAYTVFLILSIPTSMWRGGSFMMVKDQWSKSFMAFVLAAGLVITMRHSVKAIRVQSYGLLLAALLALFKGVESMGRLSMAQGVYEGANELAAAMVLGAICWWFNTYNPAHSKIWRMLCIFPIVPLLYVMFRTGSRAAFFSLLAIIPFIFLRYSSSGKLVFMTLTLGGLLGVLAVTPAMLTNRLLTFFNPGGEVLSASDADQVMATTGSTRQRFHLLTESLKLTIKHPLFGVGTGNFAVAENDSAMSEGRPRGSWLGTHNTYTQISSENGIPALIAFLACFWLARKELLTIEGIHRTRSDLEGREIVATAFILRIVLYSYLAFFMFAHIAYDHTVPTFFGIIVGFARASQTHVDETILAAHRAKRFAPVMPPASA